MVKATKTRTLRVALATLPLYDPAASVTELTRVERSSRKCPGAMLFSNINGVALERQRFWPMYEAANRLGAILHIHPTNPVGVEAMLDYWLMPLVGFLDGHDARRGELVFSGVTERYPQHTLGARPSRRHDSVSGRAPGSRL